jgi:1-acyl-sn-glycerol-3-phosphate acyltransferase
VSNRWRHPGWSGAATYAVAAGLVGAVLTMFARLQVAGARGRAAVVRRLPDGPVIVISNHTSYVDGLLLAIVCRRLGRSARMLAAAGVFKAPVIGAVARRIGFIPVDRGAANAADALGPAEDALAAGELVAIFPEGRLTRDPDRWPEKAKTGAVRLALRTGAPIVPVALEGAYRVVGRRKFVSNLLKNVVLRPKVATAVGEPIQVRELLQGSETPDEIRRVTDVVWSHLIDLVEQLRGQQSPADAGMERVEDAV